MEQRGLKLVKGCTQKRKAASQGTKRVGGKRRKKRKVVEKVIGGRKCEGAVEYSTIIILIEINFKYP